LIFNSEFIARNAKAGQFLDIRVNHTDKPLLRRPLSIHSAKGIKVSVIYEVIGPGTQALSLRAPGELLDVIGPLGNGFEYLRIAKKSPRQRVVLVAGGIGVAPLVLLAEKLKLSKPLVLVGATTKRKLLCEKEFKNLGCSVKISTDDGSLGFKGRVTDLLKVNLAQGGFSNIFACGPEPMLKSIARIADEENLNSQLSLETHMACGIGACLGCVITTKSGYRRVCKDGPVFSGKELNWQGR
jgi:dihydroorotate dehydrogenase electron transfer subunit